MISISKLTFSRKLSFSNLVPFQLISYCVFSKYLSTPVDTLLIYSNCFFNYALFLGKAQWLNTTPRRLWKCLGLISLALVAELFPLQMTEDSFQTAFNKQTKILLVNVTEKPRGRSSGTVWSEAQWMSCGSGLSRHIVVFCSLFCLHSQAAPLSMVAKYSHIITAPNLLKDSH